MKQKMPQRKGFLLLLTVLMLSALCILHAAAQTKPAETGGQKEAHHEKRILNDTASTSEAKRPSESGEISPASPSFPKRAPNAVMALSNSLGDQYISESEISSAVQDLSVSITKTASGNMVFEIRGRVRGPYWQTSTGYNHYWGPFFAFSMYGQPASPGIEFTSTNNSAISEYKIAANQYHEVPPPGTGGYKLRRFVNQTQLYTTRNTDVLRAGKTLTAYASPDHSGINDGCELTKITVGEVVSFSHNVPTREKNGSTLFDLVVRFELANLHESVTGFYVGKYHLGWYSSSGADANAVRSVSNRYLDLSQAFMNAKIGLVELRFDPGSGSGGPGSVRLQPGSAYAPPSPAPPLGHRFLSWRGWTGTVPQQSAVYQAQYAENVYHISFDSAGGSAANALRNIPYTALSHQFPSVQKKGYRHTGWRLL